MFSANEFSVFFNYQYLMNGLVFDLDYLIIDWYQEVFSFIAVLVFKLLGRKVLFINRKENRNCYRVGYFLNKIANFTGESL